MANAIAKAESSPKGKPQLPASLASVLSDPDHGAWQVPDIDWMAKRENGIKQALDALRAATTPAGEGCIRELLAKLAAYKGSRAGVPAEWKLRTAEYLRLLSHYPADLWRAAIDEWALASRWFPDASELNDIMRPKLAERETQVRRLQAMLDVLAKHRAPAPACALWNAKQRELRMAVGDRDYGAWLAGLIVLGDDGETITLAVPTPFFASHVAEAFGAKIEAVTKRRLRCSVVPSLSKAIESRRRDAQQELRARAKGDRT